MKFEEELRRQSDEAASKVNAVLARAEEQGRMLESLHTSVSFLKGLVFCCKTLRAVALKHSFFDFLIYLFAHSVGRWLCTKSYMKKSIDFVLLILNPKTLLQVPLELLPADRHCLLIYS